MIQRCTNLPPLVASPMQKALLIAFLVSSLPVWADAQVVQPKPQPEAKEVLALLGRPTSEVIAKFGYPTDVDVITLSKQSRVRLDYDTFGFSVRDKQIEKCEFYNAWKAPIRGVKILGPIDDVDKSLGQPKQKIVNADGSGVVRWDVDGNEFKLVFNPDKKCLAISVTKDDSKK